MSVQYELTSLRWGHTQTCVGGGGGARCVRGAGRGGGASTHISTKLSESEEGGGAVRWRLELPTCCIREGGGAVWRQLELSTLWREGGGALLLEGEANLPYWSRACLFTSSECLLTIADLMLKK
jgi:hypothetical protein